jgi:signal transduction histidine kinase
MFEMMKLNLNTQTKTALLILAGFFSIIILFSGFVYFSVSNYSNEDFYQLLEVRAYAVARAELDEGEDALPYTIPQWKEDLFEKLPYEQDYFFPIIDGYNFWMEAEQLALPLSFFQEIVREGHASYNSKGFFYKGIKYNGLNGNYVVITSAENYFESHHAAFLRRTLLFAIFLASVFSIVISRYFAKSIFDPISRITGKVNQISSENLHLRLEAGINSGELSQLTQTFNDMLDRIETSFETQNNFISNASHELRTPLTAIIGEADVALAKLRKPEDYIESLKIILDEAEKLDNKTKALLFLAQTGFNGKIQKFDKVRIDQLLMDVKETIEKINPKSKIRLDMSLLPENPVLLKVKGNDQLLHLAFTNIISNACKYSDYKLVNVSLGASENKVIVVVKDSGIGIPESELKFIYDPFFRASNTKNYEGYGIGLPLTQNIIRMHQGEILVSSIQNSGTTVQINLPIGGYSLD